MKKLTVLMAFLMMLFVSAPKASATQSWNFTSNSNPKAVYINANMIAIGSASSSSWGTWINDNALSWDSTNKCWSTVFTANNGGFDFCLKCVNSSNGSYYYKAYDSNSKNITYSNGKASYDYIVNENDGNGSTNFYMSGLTTGNKYVLKLTAHPGVTHCADLTVEPYTETSQGGGQQGGTSTTTAYLMGIGGDWTTGISTTNIVDNQATFTVAKWVADTEFKFKVNSTWYGKNTNYEIVNGQWYDYPSTMDGCPNFSLPNSATGKEVVFNLAVDNGHFKVSWPTSAAPMSPQANYPGGIPKPGIVNNVDGSVTFCFAAPLKNNVKLCGSWNSYDETDAAMMNYQDYNGFRYFWKTVTGLTNDVWYPYYFFVDGEYVVADPYAPLILDQKYDATLPATVFADRPAFPTAVSSKHPIPTGHDTQIIGAYKKNVHDYNWECTSFTPAPRSTISIYELLIRDFTGTDNTADGTYAKALEKLPYLVDLGITAIELMPVMEFQYNTNWGYDSTSHFAPDKSYGSPDELKHFIDECHKNGIAVILDIVFNHVTDEHAWKAMYEPGTSPFLNASAPHAWSVHNDIRQEYGLVEPYLKDALSNWLENYKVDGFRFDLVKGMGDNSSYNDNYSGDKSNSTTTARMKRLHAHMMTINPNVFHINEFFGHYDDDVVLGNDGQMVWNHQMHAAQLYAAGVYKDGEYGDLQWLSWSKISRPTWGTVDYIESHDEQWLGYCAKNSQNTNVSGSEDKQCKLLAACGAQLLVAYGPKMIWMFGELGNDDYLGDDRLAAKKVRWNYMNNENRMAIHETYKSMLEIRNLNQDLFGADVAPIYQNFSKDNENPRAVRLTKGNKELVLLLNPIAWGGSKDCTSSVTKLNAQNYYVVTASKGFTPEVSFKGGNVTVSLPECGFCVLASNDVYSSKGGPEAITDDWYVVGSALGTEGATSWVDAEAYKMTNNGDGTYTISLPRITGTFKVKQGGTWTTSLGTNGSVIVPGVAYNATVMGENIELPGVMTNVTITARPAAHTITITGTVKTAAAHTVAITCASINWSTSDNKVTVPAGSNAETEITVSGWHNHVDGVTGDGFKVILDNNWLSNGQEVALDTWTSVTSGNDNNMTLPSECEGKTVKFVYNVETKQLKVSTVYVKPVVDTLIMSEDEVEINVGDFKVLTYTYAPEAADAPSVVWTTSDPNVATVTSTGHVSAIAPGTATITVKVATNASIYATCEVTVPTPPAKVGDINNDGYVDIQDVYDLIDLIHNGVR